MEGFVVGFVCVRAVLIVLACVSLSSLSWVDVSQVADHSIFSSLKHTHTHTWSHTHARTHTHTDTHTHTHKDTLRTHLGVTLHP